MGGGGGERAAWGLAQGTYVRRAAWQAYKRRRTYDEAVAHEDAVADTDGLVHQTLEAVVAIPAIDITVDADTLFRAVEKAHGGEGNMLDAYRAAKSADDETTNTQLRDMWQAAVAAAQVGPGQLDGKAVCPRARWKRSGRRST